MFLWISAVGILLLIGLRVYSVWMDRPAEGIKKHFQKEMTRAIVEFLAIVLSVTIGINFDEWQQDKQQKEQIVALLDVSVGEIRNSCAVNELFLQPYANLEEGQTVPENVAAIAKSNARCNLATIEKILDMESVMATISPGAYNTMCNCIDNAQIYYDRLQTLDNKTQGDEIRVQILGVNVHMEMLISVIELERRHLDGELTAEQVMVEYGDRWFDVNPYLD